MKNFNVTIGCDPELFLRHRETGKYVSAHNLLPGTKKEPHWFRKFGAVQVDGTAAEINIRPAENAKTFVSRIQAVQNSISQGLLKGEYELAADTVVRYDQDVWDSIPKEAKELGCDPDYNAYTGEVNPVPDQEADFRTGAGHIHIGWTEGMDPHDEGHFEACRILTRTLDFYLGVDLQWLEGDNERRRLYGKAGAFRPKSYGCEYRVPSNFWLKSPTLMQHVFNVSRDVFNALVRQGAKMEPEGVRSYAAMKYIDGEGFDGMTPEEVFDAWVAADKRRWLEATRKKLINEGVIHV